MNNVQFIRENISSVESFYHYQKMYLNYSQHYSNNCSHLKILGLFFLGFQNEFKHKVNKLTDHVSCITNYAVMAANLVELVKLVEDNDIEKIKKHSLFYVYDMITLLIQYNELRYKTNDKNPSPLKKAQQKRTRDRKHDYLFSKLRNLNELFDFGKKEALSSQDIDDIKKFYSYLILEHFPNINKHSLQAELILEGKTDKLNCLCFLKSNGGVLSGLTAEIKKLEFNPVSDIEITEQDLERLKKIKENDDMINELNNTIEKYKIRFSDSLSHSDKRIARF